MSAPAVTAENYDFAGPEQIRSAGDAVHRALSRAVAVIEKVFSLRIIDGDNRVFQSVRFGHAAQADHARGGFFRSADNVLNQFFAFGMHRRNQVCAVISGNLRFVVQRGHNVFVISLGVLTLDCVGRDAVFHQGRGHVILSAQRVRGAENRVRAAGF